ncbi:MAG: VOC family protein [Hyphomonadaceae bacterium]|nr:VOC family protein [Hyphomonadaceae bacterium]
MSIFSHITIGVNDLEKSIWFYDKVLAELGLSRHSTGDGFAGYGPTLHKNKITKPTGENSLWILKPSNGEIASGSNGTNIALSTRSRERIDAFYAVCIDLGATSEGSPGLRKDIHDNFYACYIVDYDGNKIVAVCHEAQ